MRLANMLGQILWAFSIWLESVAILPQLFMLQRTGEAETITTHYLFALGAYRALYIPNWIYRWFAEPTWNADPIAVLAGVVQTVLYSDFFWIYYTKYVESRKTEAINMAVADIWVTTIIGSSRAKSSPFQSKSVWTSATSEFSSSFFAQPDTVRLLELGKEIALDHWVLEEASRIFSRHCSQQKIPKVPSINQVAREE